MPLLAFRGLIFVRITRESSDGCVRLENSSIALCFRFVDVNIFYREKQNQIYTGRERYNKIILGTRVIQE